MSDSLHHRRKRSKSDIDISTRASGPSLGWRANVILWGGIFGTMVVAFTAAEFFEVSQWWAIVVIPLLAILIFVGWVGWTIVVKRGVFTWMRVAQVPEKLWAQGDSAGAEAAYEKAMARAKRFADTDHRRGMMLCALAMYARNQGRYPETLDLYAESATILALQADRQPLDYLTALNNHAICLIYLKDFAAAQERLEKAYDLLLAARKRKVNAFQVLPETQVRGLEFLLHMNLAVLFLTMNEVADADRQLDEAEKALELVSPAHQKAWHDHFVGMRALCYFESGQFAEATREIAQADDPDYIVCLRVRAKLHMLRLEFAQAESLLRKLQDAEFKIGSPHRPERLKSNIEFADCMFEQNKHEEALEAVQSARTLVADFTLPTDAGWRKTLQRWAKRARDLGKVDLAASLEKESQMAPVGGEQAIMILDKFRASRQAPG